MKMAESSTCCSTSCDCETYEVTVEEVPEHIVYLNKSTKEQKERIKKFLLNLDKSNRINPDSQRRNNVIQGITQIVTEISKKIEEINPLFRGTILPAGSAHNNTKIGDSNELDFVFELEIDTLFNGKGTVQCVSDYGIIVKFEGEPDSTFCKPFEQKMSSEPGLTEECNPENCMLLDADGVKSHLSELLKIVISGLELPRGWQHGGFNRPYFSGIRKQGPSFVLQFDYLDTTDTNPLYISVDFVPMIKLALDKNKEVEMNYLDLFSTKTTGAEYCWWSFHDSCDYYGTSEETILSRYSVNSIAKVLIRTTKALHGLVGMYSPKYPFLDDVEKFADSIKQNELMKSKSDTRKVLDLDLSASAGFLRVYDSDEYLSYSDLGETVGDECMLKSYDIKRLVMSLMAVDEAQGKDWTEEDIPDLIISIYMLLENMLRMTYLDEEESDETTLIEEEITVPLEHLVDYSDEGKADQVISMPAQASNLPSKEEYYEPKFYTAYAKVIQTVDFTCEIQQPLLKSKISAIFQLLRCVCDGKNSATISALKRVPKNDVDIKDCESRLVTKREFRDMLNTERPT